MINVVSPFQRAHELLEEIRPLADRRWPESELSKSGLVIAELQARLKDQRFQVMIFGTYNAGKSTLINALIGKDVAAVRDIPTTDTVDRYDWCGHFLIDTPGVNAPIEHENVTQEELKKVDLVLFVVRGGDQDAQDVYKRLLNLLNDGRAVFIVLNRKSGATQEDWERQAATMNKLLLRQAVASGIPVTKVESIPVSIINAESARKGRIENKSVLREKSGCDEFVMRFNHWLSNYESAEERIKLTVETIDRLLLNPLRKETEKDSGDTSKLKTLGDEISRYNKLRTSQLASARNWLQGEVGKLRGQIRSLADSGAGEIQFNEVYETLLNKLAARLEEELSRELLHSEKPVFTGSALEAGDKTASGTKYSEHVKKILGSVNKEHINAALMAGRAAGIPLLKGRWASTLDKWAGRAAPALQAILVLWNVKSAHDDEQKRNEEMRAAAVRFSQLLEEIRECFEDSLFDAAKRTIEATFESLQEPLRVEQEALLQNSQQFERDRVEIDRFHAEFKKISEFQ